MDSLCFKISSNFCLSSLIFKCNCAATWLITFMLRECLVNSEEDMKIVSMISNLSLLPYSNTSTTHFMLKISLIQFKFKNCAIKWWKDSMYLWFITLILSLNLLCLYHLNLYNLPPTIWLLPLEVCIWLNFHHLP